MAMAMMIIDIVDDDGNDVGENVAEGDGTTVGLRFFQNEMVVPRLITRRPFCHIINGCNSNMHNTYKKGRHFQVEL